MSFPDDKPRPTAADERDRLIGPGSVLGSPELLRPGPRDRVPIWTSAVIYILIILLLISVLTRPGLNQNSDLSEQEKDRLCVAHSSAFPSPVEADLALGWTRVRSNVSFGHPSIYQQLASPAVDQAWVDLGVSVAPFIISDREAATYGLQAGLGDGQARRVAAQGGDHAGSGGYVATLAAPQLLQCLNLLRQSSHFDYAYYRGEGVFAGPEEQIRRRMGHCLDMLREYITCSADATIYHQVWAEGYGPVPAPGAQLKCRNYADVLQWARDKQVSRLNEVRGT